MRRTAALGPLLALLLLAPGCAETLPKSDMRSGLSQEAVRAQIEKPPERTSEFALPEQPELKFTVLEYLLAPQPQWPEQPYWMLFNDAGLISFGAGGLREAKARAYDSYYDWMAAQGDMPRTVAELRFRETLERLYGAELNPMVNEYLLYRTEVMGQVDAEELDPAEAERLVYQKYLALDARNRTPDAPLLEPGKAKRFDVLEQMGLDQASARLAQRPRSGALSWSLACDGMSSRLGISGRCR